MTEGTCKLVLFAIISIVTFLKSEPVNKLTLKFGIILMTESDKPFDMRRVLPSLTLAFERIEEDLDISVEPVIHNYTGSCPWDAPVGKLSKLYHEYRVAGIIGPACSQGLESAGRLAQYLKIPIVSGLGDLLIREPFLGDMYETLTILSYNLKKLSCKYINATGPITQPLKVSFISYIYSLKANL